MPSPNFAPSTIWTGDNLPILRGMNSACVDLIYLDPPFNSNRNYEALIGSKAAGAAFKDAWTLSDVDVCEHGELADRNPAVYAVIAAAREAHGNILLAPCVSHGTYSWFATNESQLRLAHQIQATTQNQKSP